MTPRRLLLLGLLALTVATAAAAAPPKQFSLGRPPTFAPNGVVFTVSPFIIRPGEKVRMSAGKVDEHIEQIFWHGHCSPSLSKAACYQRPGGCGTKDLSCGGLSLSDKPGWHVDRHYFEWREGERSSSGYSEFLYGVVPAGKFAISGSVRGRGASVQIGKGITVLPDSTGFYSAVVDEGDYLVSARSGSKKLPVRSCSGRRVGAGCLVAVNRTNATASFGNSDATLDVAISGLTVSGVLRSEGNLTVTGGLRLDAAVLFVNGNLTVEGGIRGTGTIAVRGQATVRGAVDLTSDSVTALAAGGPLLLLGQ